MGIATFLITMLQLQALTMGYYISVYLQANMGMKAALWYKTRGFCRVTNDINSLPASLKSCYKTREGPYLHFVSTDKIIQDFKKRGMNPYQKDNKQQFLNLLHLNIPIQTRVSSDNIFMVSLTKSHIESERQP